MGFYMAEIFCDPKNFRETEDSCSLYCREFRRKKRIRKEKTR